MPWYDEENEARNDGYATSELANLSPQTLRFIPYKDIRLVERPTESDDTTVRYFLSVCTPFCQSI
jgi:hypothetical protein